MFNNSDPLMDPLMALSFMRIVGIGLALFFVLGQFACTEGDDNMLGNIDKERAEQTRRLIADELAVGAAPQAIEEFFLRHGIAYSYDRFAHRYQAIIRGVSPDPRVDQAVSIFIYVDDQGRFVRAEAHDTFTAL